MAASLRVGPFYATAPRSARRPVTRRSRLLRGVRTPALDHRRLLRVAPIRPARIVVPRRVAEAFQDEGVDRGAAAALAVGDDRLARLHAGLLHLRTEGGLGEEAAIG